MTDVKTLKAPKKFFDYVKEQFPIYVWENKKEKIISSERKKYTEVIKKRLTLNSRLTFSSGWKYFTYIAVSTKKIEVQTYRAYLKVTDGKEKVIIKLFVLEKFENLSIEFIGDRIVLPKDFEKAHQDAIDNYNALKHKIDQQDYQERYEKIKGLNTIIDDYQFIVPQDLNEIVKEGKTLSHCVGGYTSRHKKGETTIVLIRQVEKPLESYYTMEMHEGRLIQVRGYKNCAPDFQLKSTVETYISFANKQKIH